MDGQQYNKGIKNTRLADMSDTSGNSYLLVMQSFMVTCKLKDSCTK